ncbi:MAG: two-component system response regulator [Verrucomicrobiales bacterium]|nr:two-component system response regulator [Verrucomicrobiales bacterium]
MCSAFPKGQPGRGIFIRHGSFYQSRPEPNALSRSAGPEHARKIRLGSFKWLRAQPATVTLPVVVFTSSNQERDIHRAYIFGANGYLVKPGKPDELLAMVKGVRDYWLIHNRVPESSIDLDTGSSDQDAVRD